MENILILILAIAIDLVFGEPPSVLHPVVWMGKFTSLIERLTPGRGSLAQLIYGAGAVLLAIGFFAIPIYFLLPYLRELSQAAYVIVGALVLKSTFSVRELRRVAHEVKGLLIADNLHGARAAMRSLVSRDTSGLDKPLLVSATVESVAENTCDSFVSPLFYFILFGLPGAIAYRVVNTFDAMIGYHGKYEYLGKFAARLDDALNFLPARLTSLMMAVAAFLSGKRFLATFRVSLRDHAKTESPNAGWTMSAAAGALNVQLEKKGHYILGDPNSLLLPETIDSSLRIMGITALLWGLLCFLVEVVYLAFIS